MGEPRRPLCASVGNAAVRADGAWAPAAGGRADAAPTPGLAGSPPRLSPGEPTVRRPRPPTALSL